MLDEMQLTIGLYQELGTYSTKKYARAFMSGWYAVMNAYDETHQVVAPCTGDLTCTREGVRHKSGCSGKIEPFDKYARALV